MNEEDWIYEWFMQQLLLLLTPTDDEEEVEEGELENGVFIAEGS